MDSLVTPISDVRGSLLCSRLAAQEFNINPDGTRRFQLID